MLPLLACLALPCVADFEKDVVPILARRCLECHSGEEAAGKLDLTRESALRQGGRSGPAVTHGQPGTLMERVTDGRMPPPAKGLSQTLPLSEQTVLANWVSSGAVWPKGRVLDPLERSTEKRGGRDLWSLQPVRATTIPSGQHPIDYFVETELRTKGWSVAPPADRPTQLRRLSIDLTGLPPTSAEVESFQRDNSPDAYEKQVDRLLASPRFGERRARQWLDVVRWAETSGYERDQDKPFAWKYRDWLISAFNNDIPLKRFIVEQMAGDEIPERTESSVIATGMLRLGTWNDEPNDAREYQYDRLEDLVHVTGTAFLAMTIKCARCHDHKFDPVSQHDYYRVAAAFWPGPVRAGSAGPLGGPPVDRTGKDVLAWADLSATPPPLHLLKKGDHLRPGSEVPFGYPSMVPILAKTPLPVGTGASTGRRLALAKWITDPQNPLTWRVWANRLWAAHFGEGIVRSLDLFGFTGDRPTHPALLDWLATELLRTGGRSKAIHRLIVTSKAYKQSSLHPMAAEYEAVDASNKYLWHAPRKRLDAETLRDAMLQSSGLLDTRRVGGPSFYPEISAEALEGWSRKGSEWKPSPPEEQGRRSLYAYAKRGLPEPTRAVFDAPDGTLPCGKRDVTLAAPQALALLNNAFIWKQARSLVEKAGDNITEEDFISHVWLQTLARQPRADERTAASAHLLAGRRLLGLEKEARTSLALVLMNTNEFMFID